MHRKRVPGVGSGNRKSSAADGSQSDWRHDQTVSSGRTQSSSTRDINSRGERPRYRGALPWRTLYIRLLHMIISNRQIDKMLKKITSCVQKY